MREWVGKLEPPPPDGSGSSKKISGSLYFRLAPVHQHILSIVATNCCCAFKVEGNALPLVGSRASSPPACLGKGHYQLEPTSNSDSPPSGFVTQTGPSSA